MQTSQDINTPAFVPAVLFAVAFVICGLASEQLGSFLQGALDLISNVFGAGFLLFALFLIFLVLAISFSRVGDIRIGGPKAQPIYKRTTWFALALNGCIGTGILFWAMGEPLFHLAQPPAAADVEPFSREAAIFAVSQTMIHWTMAQYCMYAFCGLVIALLCYNRKKELSITAFLQDSLSPRCYAAARNSIHAINVCCIAGAVSCSMGVGLMQMASGLEYLQVVPANSTTWLWIDAALGLVFITSSLLGIKAGLAWISRICTLIFFFLMGYVLLFGPTVFIMDMGVTSVGQYLNRFVEQSLILPTMTVGETWSRDWNIQFIASFFVYAPILGLFLARLGKGRTVREFIWMNVFAPTVFCIAWIAIWAGFTMYLQWTGEFDVWKFVGEHGMESTIFTLLSRLPGGHVLILVFAVAVFFSLATMCDAICGTMAALSTKRCRITDEAPRHLKVFWGFGLTLTSYVLISSGGLVAVRSLFTIIGIPTAILLFLYVGYVLTRWNTLFVPGPWVRAAKKVDITKRGG